MFPLYLIAEKDLSTPQSHKRTQIKAACLSGANFSQKIHLFFQQFPYPERLQQNVYKLVTYLEKHNSDISICLKEQSTRKSIYLKLKLLRQAIDWPLQLSRTSSTCYTWSCFVEAFDSNTIDAQFSFLIKASTYLISRV